jgi:conserved hypothetical protein, steroid delta-isomerase-related
MLDTYYQAFNDGDRETMFSLLSSDVIHDLNQGGRETGIDAFRAFMDRMDRCYEETLEDIVILTSEDGTRASAEFNVRGRYLSTDEGLPEATGQTYLIPAGAFFNLHDGKITRITMYYNLQQWLEQIGD